MKIRGDALTRNGYRLPTEAEWEYACRAGDSTSRYLRTDSRSLKRIAWYNVSSEGQAWPRGGLLPNDLGLFDMLGNVYEWCHNRHEPYPSSDGSSEVDRDESPETVLANEARITRGGGFVDIPGEVRSAYRAWNDPHNQLGAYGFRVARTMP